MITQLIGGPHFLGIHLESWNYPNALSTVTLREETDVPIYFQMRKMEGFFPTLGKRLGRNRVIAKETSLGFFSPTEF